MDHYDDIELVKLSVDGETEAYAHLVKRHYMTVYRVSYKWCGVRENAEDITNEVFIKLAQKLKTFKQKSSFKTWLYRIVINTAKDFHRKRSNEHAYDCLLYTSDAADE